MKTEMAFCGADGLLFFGPRLLPGMLPVAVRPARVQRREKWRQKIEAFCRKAHQHDGYLVQGLPESSSQREALDALTKFRRMLRDKKLSKI